ncbi:MAG: sulfatase [Pseudomonadota bacterium]
MWKKALLGVLALIVIGAGIAWMNRVEIILYMVTRASHQDVAPHKEVTWQQGPASAETPLAERPPNIIFILADDLGINDISTFGGGVGNGTAPTPNIDRLAAEGAIFTQAYSGTGTCAPSRAMLMTGRYPTRTGFEFTPTPAGMGRMMPLMAAERRDNDDSRPPVTWNEDEAESAPPYVDQGLPGSEITIAEVLKSHGYQTAHIGKWHLGRNAETNPNAQGFDDSLAMSGGLFLPEDAPNVVNAKLAFDPIDRFLWASQQYATRFNEGELLAPGGYLTDYWTDEALKVIDANKNRPFFLYLAHWGVHTPLQATKEDYEAVGDIEPRRERVYAAMLRAVDRSVGRVMDKLEAEGLAENTIIVFSSDNGGAGYLGLPDVNAPYRGWKITLFEGGIRVPMFIKWPAKIAPGTVLDTPVAHIDVMPTLASAAGADLPEGVIIDGRDMLPEATGEGVITRDNDALYWSSGFYQVVRAGDWKLQRDQKYDRSWLYDLASDPTEEVNLADTRPDKLAELNALIEAHFSSRRKPLYPHTVESPILIDKHLAQEFEPGDEYIVWAN